MTSSPCATMEWLPESPEPVYVLLRPGPAAHSTTASMAPATTVVVHAPQPDPGHHAQLRFAPAPKSAPAWLPVGEEHAGVVGEFVLVAAAVVACRAWRVRRMALRGP